MTNAELYNTISPVSKKYYYAQLSSNGLEFCYSDMFCRLIKDAARCNRYNSDIFYDMKYIDQRMKNFTSIEDFDPIWIGFRKDGVDHTDFVLCRVSDKALYGDIPSNYFALYSIVVEKAEHDMYKVVLNEYNV